MKASELFSKSGLVIQEMTDIITEYLLKERRELDELPYKIRQISDFEEEAYK
jgi:hypothetical protein